VLGRRSGPLSASPCVRGLLAAATLATAIGCGGSPTQATGGNGGSAGAGGSEDGGSFGFGGQAGGGPIVGEDDACAKAAIEGEPVPVTMFLMFDKSGSMLDDQKWAGAKAALVAFFQNPESAGLSIALRFFPSNDPAPGCNETACDANACAQPLVDAGPLNAQPASGDPQQAALVAAVNATSPGGETPMFAALAGAEQWAQAHAGDGKVVVVLVTDGEPNGCNEDPAAIAGLAAVAKDAGVLTYAIGMEGSNEDQMNLIATAGGTGSAFFVGAGSVHTALLAAFEQIKTTQIACTFDVPAPADGSTVDPTLVNVNVVSSGGQTTTLPEVADENACGSGAGWHYDDPASPTQILLCPASCQAAQADIGAKVKILLGCATVAN